MIIEDQDAPNRYGPFAQLNRPRNYHRDSGPGLAQRIRCGVKASLPRIANDRNGKGRRLFKDIVREVPAPFLGETPVSGLSVHLPSHPYLTSSVLAFQDAFDGHEAASECARRRRAQMLNLAVTIPFTEPPSRVGREPVSRSVCGRRPAPTCFEKINRVGFHLWLPLLFPDSGTRHFREPRYLPVVLIVDPAWPSSRLASYSAAHDARYLTNVLVADRRRILQQCFEPWVLAQRVPDRRVSKFAGVNPARYFKQVRKRINRCIDFTQLRQSFCAESLGNRLK
jgi:hypothetical protein